MRYKLAERFPCAAIVGSLIAVGVGALIGLVVAIAIITAVWGHISL